MNKDEGIQNEIILQSNDDPYPEYVYNMLM